MESLPILMRRAENETSCEPALLRAWLFDFGSLCFYHIGLGLTLALGQFLQPSPFLKIALCTESARHVELVHAQ